MDNAFGNKVRQLRMENHMTMEDVEQGTGISRSSISRWEHGRSMPNSWKTVKILADFFKVSVSYLLGEENPPPSAFHELEKRIAYLESLHVNAHNGHQ